MTTREYNLKRVLVINPFGIGDVLFTTPVVRNLKKNRPDVYIGYLCNIRTVKILEANPNIDKVFVFEKDHYRDLGKESKLKCLKEFNNLLNSVKKEKFDAAIDLSLGKHYSFFSWLIGIKKRIGFNYKNRGVFLTDKINIDGYQAKHVVEYYLDLLKFLNIEYKDSHLDLFVPDEARKWADGFLSEQGIIAGDTLVAVIPGGGASWGKDASIKQWPAEKFAAVARRLAEELKLKILVMGDLKDKESCLKVVDGAKNSAIDCCGKTDIAQFAALLAKTKLVIANDGGPLHLAVAVGAKTVSIFGPVDDKVYGPYPRSKNHIVIKTRLACQPCYQRFKLLPCDNNKQCLRDVREEEVFGAAKELLKQ
ncbi:MAG TPA: lipopolysaccharide heptosyltransferase II [Candidatus Omnitrophota bacterium]|nr:lipopolysaccharide heptosyltransferase II [Candidatus Omnitrophota bacterium]